MEKTDIYIVITTHNRQESLYALLEDIKKNIGTFSYTLKVYDDASDINYVEDIGCDYTRYAENKGKAGYWQIINQAFVDASASQFNYFFLLQDDCRLVDGFFAKAINEYNEIKEPSKATLCTFTPTTIYSRLMWSNSKARDVFLNTKTYINCGYVDCIFMCPRATLSVLQFRIDPIASTRFVTKNISSGVGQQLTERLKKMRRTMWCAYSSLIVSHDNDSKMNQEEREKNPMNPLLRENYTVSEGTRETVTVGMASIPERKDAVVRAVLSLYNQVDKIYLYLNEYQAIPKQLILPKVEIIHSQNFGDQGDAGKFFKVADTKGYYFSCDDDILYPPDYIARSINEIEKYHRECIITYHGAVLKFPVRSYYRDRTQYHFRNSQVHDVQVHVGGTGVMAFHTDAIKVQLADFKIPNMADIWMGILAQKQHVPIWCLARSANWLKMLPGIPVKKTIYGSNLNHDVQTDVVNDYLKIGEWKL